MPFRLTRTSFRATPEKRVFAGGRALGLRAQKRCGYSDPAFVKRFTKADWYRFETGETR
jgi:hypothetical protein